MDAMTGSDGSVAVEPGGEPAGPPRVSGRQLRELLADDLWLDELIDRAGEGGVRLTGEGGFLPELVKAVLERCWRRS
jgi:putative transposase